MAGHLVSSQSRGLQQEQQVEITPFRGGDAPFAAQESREDGVNWGRYIAALKRYRWLMLVIVLVGSGAGVAVSRLMPPEYQATTTVWVESGGGGRAGPLRPGELLNAMGWVQLLQTPLVYDPVVHKLKLYVAPKLPRDTLPFTNFDVSERFRTGIYTLAVDETGQRWTLFRRNRELEQGQVGDSIGTKLGWRWAPTAAQLGKGREIPFTLKDPRAVVGELTTRLRAMIPPEGSFLKITLGSKDRRRVADVVNAISAEFVEIAADLKKRKLTELRLALDSQVSTAYQNLRAAESQLKNFQISTMTSPRTGVLPVAPGLSTTTGQATAVYFQQKVEQDRIRQDREQLEAVLTRSRAGAITVDAFQTIPSVNQAPQLKASLSELTLREAELSALLQRYTPEHPLVKQAQTQIDLLRSQHIPQYAQALIDQLKLQEQDLASRLGSAATELREVPEVTITENRLTREMAAADELYKMLAQRLEEAKLSELSAIPDVRVLDLAVPPQKPSSNTAPKIILMALAGSLGLAVGLALLLDQLDKRFRYPEQVSTELGLPILGAVPAIKKTRRGELAPEQAAQVVEAFRTVRLNLAHSYGAAGPVTLTISSAGAGDGKSLVSSNLAVSFAEAGYRTLLIDGDIRRGEIHRMFGVDRRPGLLDFLTAGATYDDIIRPTSQRNLSVIPCGTRRHQGPELLGSAAMAELMAQLKAQFNVIIVDSPPLGAGIDPFVLGTTTGHMVMVFRTGETDRQMAEAKLRLLDRLPVRVLGAVLNEIQAEGIYRYYSYLYGYTADEEPAQIAAQSSGSTGEG
jgi:capsular exopolysaccharide synthesis family protein